MRVRLLINVTALHVLQNIVVSLLLSSLPQGSAERECVDMHGRAIGPGYHYIPGPAACTLCICSDGSPHFCKAVLCSPPTDCKSFRVGASCCEFICLDDDMKHGDSLDPTAELSLRYVASAISAILLLSVSLVLAYRIRRRRQIRAAMRSEANSSLASIGYMGGSAGYVAAEEGAAGLPGGKPRSEYVPRGEAPPPYDEAVAQARVDAMRLSSEHRSALAAQSAAIEAAMRRDERPPPHIYSNLPRSVQQAATQCYGYDAPLLQPVNAHPNHSERPRVLQARTPPYHLPDLVGLGLKAASSGASLNVPSGMRLTGSLGAITNRGLLGMIQRDARVDRSLPPAPPAAPPAFFNPHLAARAASLHRTIPRLSTADLAFEPNSDPGFVRASRLQYLELRRSFHRAGERAAADAGGSIPRDLDRAARRLDSDGAVASQAPLDLEGPTRRATVREINQEFVEDAARRQKGTILHLMGLFNDLLPAQHRVQMPELPVPVDQPSCLCYTDTAADEADTDEYRSECENCKSASGSRWVLEEGWAEAEEEGTQTLQRRAPPAAAPPPATATLPQPLTKQRSNPGLSSNWDNWFNVIQDSSSSDED